jgi:UDP-N-acetylmuramoyl-tripeptide--D-alanyl-D-alanine ligase
MTKLFTSSQAENATNGNSLVQWEAMGVSIDSRNIQNGDLFIALIGDNVDGHKYVANALSKGAAAAMVSYVPDDVDEDAPLLVVKDTMEGLYDLAEFARARLKGKLALITGSVGKTSTKEMLAHTLDHQGKVFFTEGNLNNHYGLPLTLSRMPADTDYAILEVGMNHADEISPLSVLAKPHVAVITTVEAVHLEFFDSVEGIADAKAEIFDGLLEGGTAILNRDNAHYLRLRNNALEHDIHNFLAFGKGAGCDFQLLSVEQGEINIRYDEHKTLTYKLGIDGIHQVLNSLAVLAAVYATGSDVEKAAATLADFEAEAGRGKSYKLRGSYGQITLIDDCYNASPASVAAALQVLSGEAGRKVAVLGDMFELGSSAEQLHVDILEKIVENNIDLVFTAGNLMKKLYDRLPDDKKGGWEENSQSLSAKVADALSDGDVVLVKGSRGMRMENVVELIKERGKVEN